MGPASSSKLGIEGAEPEKHRHVRVARVRRAKIGDAPRLEIMEDILGGSLSSFLPLHLFRTLRHVIL